MREARVARSRAEAAYFRVVQDADENYSHLWRHVGHATFDAFLSAEDICKPASYRRFLACLKELSWPTVERLGFEFASEVIRVPSNEVSRRDGTPARQACLREGETFRHDRKVPAGRQTAAAIVRRHWEKVRVPKKVTPASEVDKLRLRCARLEREKAALAVKLVATEAKLKRALEMCADLRRRSHASKSPGSHKKSSSITRAKARS